MDKVKTIVQVTQELLALLNTRRERLQRHGDFGEDPLSDQEIRKVLDELSLSGDATPAMVDQSDPYFRSDAHHAGLFRQAVLRLRNEVGEIPESLDEVFKELLK